MEDRAELQSALEGVEGWLYLDEARALYETVRSLPSGTVIVVEIGSWKGRSTIALALAVKRRGSGRVYAIDPHTGEKDRTGTGPIQTLDDFRANIARAGVASVVELLITTSLEARPNFTDHTVDFLFVDGSHQYPDVRRDIEGWASALKDEAAIAFNDPSAPGVYRALREIVLRPGPYIDPRLVQNTLFFGFRRREKPNAAAMRRLRRVLWLRFQAARYWRFMPGWFVRFGHRVSARLVAH
jgi:predicted O-methyltransferase YrrM